MAAASDSTRRARPLLGTFVEIAATGSTSASREAAIDDAFAAVATVQRLMSVFEPDSDIGRLNRRAGDAPVAVHAWTYEVLQAATDMHRRSGGLFDVCAAPVPGQTGRSMRPRAVDKHDPPRDPPFELLPDRRVRLRDADVRVDLGGIAKGFAVDRAMSVLRARGMAFGTTSGLVNAGGDLAVFGATPQPVDIRDPRDARRSLCRVALVQGAMASSAGRYDPFHATKAKGSAVVDPRARRSISNVIGATVLASSCMIADALTKVAMIAGNRALALLRDCEAEALLVTARDALTTPGWQRIVDFAA